MKLPPRATKGLRTFVQQGYPLSRSREGSAMGRRVRGKACYLKREIISSGRCLFLVAMLWPMFNSSGQTTTNSNDDLRAGRIFGITPVYSEADDHRLLALFDGLRVADVSDGMDAAGLQN